LAGGVAPPGQSLTSQHPLTGWDVSVFPSFRTNRSGQKALEDEFNEIKNLNLASGFGVEKLKHHREFKNTRINSEGIWLCVRSNNLPLSRGYARGTSRLLVKRASSMTKGISGRLGCLSDAEAQSLGAHCRHSALLSLAPLPSPLSPRPSPLAPLLPLFPPGESPVVCLCASV
jgi:hypothetical protein